MRGSLDNSGKPTTANSIVSKVTRIWERIVEAISPAGYSPAFA